jgi:hypothetical protein
MQKHISGFSWGWTVRHERETKLAAQYSAAREAAAGEKARGNSYKIRCATLKDEDSNSKDSEDFKFCLWCSGIPVFFIITSEHSDLGQ